MANPSYTNTNQTYYWNSEPVQQNTEYYQAPSSFSQSNYNQSTSYNSSCSYNVPPPNISNFNMTNSVSHHPAPSPMCHSGSVNTNHNVPYQSQMDIQCNQYYNGTDFVQPANGNYNTSWNTNFRGTYCNNVNSEWQSNNSTNWTAYQDTSVSWYNTNRTCENEKMRSTQKYEPSQRTKELGWKYNSNEITPGCTTNRNRSRSPESRSRSPENRSRMERAYRSRYEAHRDRCRQYSKDRANVKEYRHESGDSERRSWYKRQENSVSGSEREKSYVSNKNKKRSRSQESSHSTRDSTPNAPAKRKYPTERELLLEKYR